MNLHRERLKLVPDALESLMSEKRLLQAAILLVRSLKTINNQDMLEIGAVADLRSYLTGQESVRRYDTRRYFISLKILPRPFARFSLMKSIIIFTLNHFGATRAGLHMLLANSPVSIMTSRKLSFNFFLFFSAES
jgi:hypothetical protein